MTAPSIESIQIMSRRLSLAYGMPAQEREENHRLLIKQARNLWELGEPTELNDAPKIERLDNWGIQLLPREVNSRKFARLRDLIDISDGSAGYGPEKLVSHDTLMLHEEFMELILDIEVLDILTKYFGIEPTLQISLGWRNSHSSQHTLEQRGDFQWHFDLHGHTFIKYFYYLSDVTQNHGPHEYIPGLQNLHVNRIVSHITPTHSTISALRNKLNAAEHGKNKSVVLRDEDIPELAENRLIITGKEGTRFLENTRSLHRGTPVLGDGYSRYLFQALWVPYPSNNNDTPQRVPIPMETLHRKLGHRYSDNQLQKMFGFAFKIY